MRPLLQFLVHLSTGRRRVARAVAVPALVGTAIVIAACGGSGSGYDSSNSGASSAASTAAAGPIAVHDQANIGTVLVDASGRTLYTNDQERDGTVHCTADCLGFWQPVLAPSGGASMGAVAGLDVVRRSDTDQEQLTYKGGPLYTFTLDGTGEAKGHNVKDAFGGINFTWQAATTTAAASGPASTSTPASSGSYGY